MKSKDFFRNFQGKVKVIMELQDKVRIIEDSIYILQARGIIKTQEDFAEILHVNPKSLSAAKKGTKGYCTDSLVGKIQAYMADLDRNISINHSPNSNVATGQGQININGQQQPEDQQEEDMVPVIPTNLYKEADVNIMEYMEDERNDFATTPAVQQFPKTDLFYTVQTMAMYPHLHQGDILALKAVKKSTPIVNGELYAVDTIDLGILVRFIYDRGDRIELRGSEKTDRFETFFLKKEDIFNYFRVVGLVRTNI